MCGKVFTKLRARETYCSLRCAVWSHIEIKSPDECWPWTGGLVGGYGAGTFAGKRYRASRAILAEKMRAEVAAKTDAMVGEVRLLEGTQALHRCDNPPCCNPSHIFAGTAKDNMADKIAKGRWKGESPKLRGSDHGRAVLSEDAVRDIWNNKPRCKAMADKYGIHKTTAYKIMHRMIWTHITDGME